MLNLHNDRLLIRIGIGTTLVLAVLLLVAKLLPPLLATSGFDPHGECFLWNPALLTIFAGSDMFTGMAYVAISTLLIYFVWKAYHALPFQWIFVAFGIFIVACGSTHFMDVVTLWIPLYWLSGALRVVTAIASVATAVALPPLLPKMFALINTAKVSEERKRQLEMAHVELAGLYKQLEEALQQSELRFGYLAETMPVLVWTAQPDGNIEYANQRWADTTGLSQESVQGHAWYDTVYKDDVLACKEQWLHCVETQQPYEGECRFNHVEDDYHWHLVRALPCTDKLGNLASWVGAATDIDVQKRLERLKDEFIAMASHELKTPVTSLKGFTQILLRRFKDRDDEQAVQFLTRMDNQLKKLTKLINDLLDLSRIQTGQLSYQDEHFVLDTVVRGAIEVLQTTTVQPLRYEGEEQQVVFYGDKQRIEQVLLNLLTNAIKYSPPNSPIIVYVTYGPGEAQVSVQDFGIGIAAEHQARIFERFYQVTGAVEKTFPGMGIGLYLASQIIKRHKGCLTVQSIKGEGSTFSFTLPVEGVALANNDFSAEKIS